MPDQEVEEFIEEITKRFDLNAREAFQFGALMRVHEKLGSSKKEPPEMMGIEEKAMLSYLDVSLGMAKDMDDYQESDKDDIFRTTLLMGMCLGVQLEKERHG